MALLPGSEPATSSWLQRLTVALIPVLLVQASWTLVWGLRLESRVIILETRSNDTAKQVERMETDVRRLSVIEERQRVVMEQLRTNSQKLDAVIEALTKHKPL